MSALRARVERMWYGEAGGGAWLAPLSWLYGAVVAARRAGFRRGWFESVRLARPVIVVGNLTVGGSGKTPLTAWLAAELTACGLRVGIVSRGYGGSARAPLRVTGASDPAVAGDEPVLLAARTGVPVAVGADRVAAARLLEAEVDVLLADDGLQHYRLARDLELIVVDGRRGFGNGRLLPAGPLREPPARSASADLVIVNGGPAEPPAIRMDLAPGDVVALATGVREPLAAWRSRRVHALAGIGDPARFFATLRAAGLQPIEHPRPDHAPLSPADLDYGDALPVLMTEKDAVKCRGFVGAGPGAGSDAAARAYWLEVTASFAPADAQRLRARVLRAAGRSVDEATR